MGSIIGFGKCIKWYFYFLVTTSTKLIKDDILGFENDSQFFFNLKISNHRIMVMLLGYLSEAFFGFLIYMLVLYLEYQKERKKNLIMSSMGVEYQKKTTVEKFFEQKKKEIKNNLEKSKTFFIGSDSIDSTASPINNTETIKIENNANFQNGRTVSLIHNDLYENITDNSLIYILISSCLIVTKEFLNKIIFSTHDIFDYYFLNLIIITLILRYVNNEKIYKHHLLTIIVVTIISGGCSISCLFIGTYGSDDDKKSLIHIFKGKYYIIIILILLYLILSASFCWGIIFQKKLMELKFISPYKILMYKGIIGVLGTSIGITISSLLTCNEEMNGTKNLIFEFFICSDKYGGLYYYDNFVSYFDSLNKSEYKSYEILFLFLYCIFNFASELSLVFVNKFLSPTHYLIAESLYSLIHIPLHFATNIKEEEIIKIKDLDHDYSKIYNSILQTFGTRILRFISCFCELINFLIYLEIIELKFCDFDKNLRKNIEKRAALDGITNADINSNDSDDSDDNNNNLEVDNENK